MKRKLKLRTENLLTAHIYSTAWAKGDQISQTDQARDKLETFSQSLQEFYYIIILLQVLQVGCRNFPPLLPHKLQPWKNAGKQPQESHINSGMLLASNFSFQNRFIFTLPCKHIQASEQEDKPNCALQIQLGNKVMVSSSCSVQSSKIRVDT